MEKREGGYLFTSFLDEEKAAARALIWYPSEGRKESLSLSEKERANSLFHCQIRKGGGVKNKEGEREKGKGSATIFFRRKRKGGGARGTFLPFRREKFNTFGRGGGEKRLCFCLNFDRRRRRESILAARGQKVQKAESLQEKRKGPLIYF